MTVSELEGMLRGMPGNAIVGGLKVEYDAERNMIVSRLTCFVDGKIGRVQNTETRRSFNQCVINANCAGMASFLYKIFRK